MREEAKVKSKQWSFSSAACKSATEVGLHEESPGASGGACWHFWHWSSTDLTEIRHPVNSLFGSGMQTLSKFSLIEYQGQFAQILGPFCLRKSIQVFCSFTHKLHIQNDSKYTFLTHFMSAETSSSGFYQLFFSKHVIGFNWSPCSNGAAINQQVLGLLRRLMELILEGASLCLRTGPAPSLPWLGAPTQLEQLQREGKSGGISGAMPSSSKRAFPPNLQLIRIDFIRDWVVIACICQS